MNKTEKRQNNIRNKLFAAIAMLLVSSIMMVSTTYAWFTLSTAPEVQGITTTVGANGNLEIALSPTSGDAEDITSGVGDSDRDWQDKNLTWGNLLDLSDTAYGLDGIKLMPARLYALNNVLQPSPLRTPVYGADGRVDSLEETSQLGTKLTVNDAGEVVASENYSVNDLKGVRAIGTAINQSKYAITFNNYVSAMGNHTANAQNYAKASLTTNGAKLAEMAIAHFNAEGTDANDYTAYISYMNDVVTTLQKASDEIEEALYAAVVAAAASSASDDAKYTAMMLLVDDESKTLADLLAAFSLDASNPIMGAYGSWQDIEENLRNAAGAMTTANTKVTNSQKVEWTDVSSALGYLMNTTGITFPEGKTMTQFKEMAGLFLGEEPVQEDGESDQDFAARQQAYDEAVEYMGDCITGMELYLGTGSGVYAEMAELTGDLSASVRIDIKYGGKNIPNMPVTISTTTGGAIGKLGLARTGLRTAGALTVAGQASSNVITDLYAYMVDFFFRTNASDSQLLLQTEAAQRVYEEGSSQATLGGGSTMTFQTGELDAQAVQDLMGAIRVVFVDTASSAIYGYAKLDMTTVRETVVTPADDANNIPAVLKYTADLYLYESADNGVTLTDKDETGVLCDLPANTAKAISAMVYLSGDHVDNSMVANGTESMEGTLNLQFASSANLKPMANSALENMTVPTSAPAASN